MTARPLPRHPVPEAGRATVADLAEDAVSLALLLVFLGGLFLLVIGAAP